MFFNFHYATLQKWILNCNLKYRKLYIRSIVNATKAICYICQILSFSYYLLAVLSVLEIFQCYFSSFSIIIHEAKYYNFPQQPKSSKWILAGVFLQVDFRTKYETALVLWLIFLVFRSTKNLFLFWKDSLLVCTNHFLPVRHGDSGRQIQENKEIQLLPWSFPYH